MIILKFKPRNMVIEYLLCCMCVFFGASLHVGSWFPDQGLNPCPPAVEAWGPNHRTTREVPEQLLCEQALCQKLSCF